MSCETPSRIESSPKPTDLERLIRAMPDELHRLYREIFGSDTPSGNPEYARRKIAWRLQEKREGGLPESARQHALAIAKSTKLPRLDSSSGRRGRNIVPDHATVSSILADSDSRVPMPGSVVIRNYKDRAIVVKVLAAGFEYEGRRFQSLSAIAREVTGTRWNGFLFFGLTKDETKS
jgi:hypothetical protein